MNNTFRKVRSPKTFFYIQIRTNRSFHEDEIISSEVRASRKVSIFQLFLSSHYWLFDCSIIFSQEIASQALFIRSDFFITVNDQGKPQKSPFFSPKFLD